MRHQIKHCPGSGYVEIEWNGRPFALVYGSTEVEAIRRADAIVQALDDAKQPIIGESGARPNCGLCGTVVRAWSRSEPMTVRDTLFVVHSRCAENRRPT